LFSATRCTFAFAHCPFCLAIVLCVSRTRSVTRIWRTSCPRWNPPSRAAAADGADKEVEADVAAAAEAAAGVVGEAAATEGEDSSSTIEAFSSPHARWSDHALWQTRMLLLAARNVQQAPSRGSSLCCHPTALKRTLMPCICIVLLRSLTSQCASPDCSYQPSPFCR
jgi:hypothetical protein